MKKFLSRRAPLKVRLRENLILGLITIAPAVVTLWVLITVVSYLDSFIYYILPTDMPRVPGVGVVVTVLLLLFFGSLARTVSGKILNTWTDAFLHKVPVVRGLYKVSKQMSTALFSQDSQSAFKKVVRVPFPHKQSQTLGFVTGHPSETESYVFVPTSPNPTSGYVLIFNNDLIIESTMPVQEALQLIVSCGATAKV